MFGSVMSKLSARPRNQFSSTSKGRTTGSRSRKFTMTARSTEVGETGDLVITEWLAKQIGVE
jgi:hypothetical protein